VGEKGKALLGWSRASRKRRVRASEGGAGGRTITGIVLIVGQGGREVNRQKGKVCVKMVGMARASVVKRVFWAVRWWAWRMQSRWQWWLVGDCGNFCEWHVMVVDGEERHIFIPEADCPIHDRVREHEES